MTDIPTRRSVVANELEILTNEIVEKLNAADGQRLHWTSSKYGIATVHELVLCLQGAGWKVVVEENLASKRIGLFIS